jgi:Family of unknown function (DUF6428)
MVYTNRGINLRDLKAALQLRPEGNLRFVLPDGDPIPDDFHVTEVGHVTRRFVDCGGTVRSTAACVLQAWVAGDDREHRLNAGKLASILDLAGAVIPSDELEVEVEYEGCVISQYPVLSSSADGAGLTFQLGHKHTDCLAKEACGLGQSRCGSGEGGCC